MINSLDGRPGNPPISMGGGIGRGEKCSEWYQDKRCPAVLSQKMQQLEKQLMDLYDPAWFGKQVVKKRKERR